MEPDSHVHPCLSRSSFASRSSKRTGEPWRSAQYSYPTTWCSMARKRFSSETPDSNPNMLGLDKMAEIICNRARVSSGDEALSVVEVAMRSGLQVRWGSFVTSTRLAWVSVELATYRFEIFRDAELKTTQEVIVKLAGAPLRSAH